MLSFSAISAALTAYVAAHGFAILKRVAPVATTALLLLVVYFVGGLWLKLGAGLLALAAFALGFEVGEAVESK